MYMGVVPEGMYECMYVYRLLAGDCGGQKRTFDSLEL